MTPEAQRIAIAEACGKLCRCNFGDGPVLAINYTGVTVPYAGQLIPDYLNDLNAMHEAEKRVFGKRPGYYDRAFVTELVGVLGGDQDSGMHDKRTIYWLLHATAAQRAEAFLRALNLWTD